MITNENPTAEEDPAQAIETSVLHQQRPAEEVAAIGRAYGLWKPRVQQLLDGGERPLATLTDEEVMTFFVVTIFSEWLDMRKYDPNRGGPCGYCVDAAGGTQDTWLESERFADRQALLAHIRSCRNNPLARELAAIKAGEHNVMPEDAIAAALEVCAAAMKGPAVWAADRSDTVETAIARFRKHFELAMKVTGSAVLHQVDLAAGDDDGAFCFAVTGNGPNGAANARFVAGSLDPVAGWEAALRALQWAHIRMAGLQATLSETGEAFARSTAQHVDVAKALGEGYDVLKDRYEPIWTGPDPEDENIERPSRPHTHAELVAAMVGEIRANDLKEIDKYDALATAQNERQELEEAIKEQADDLLGLQELAPAPELLSRITKQAHEWRIMLANAQIRLDAAGAPETPDGTAPHIRVSSRVDALAKRCEEMLTELRWIENTAMTVWQTAIDTVATDPEAVRRQLTYEIRDHARAGIAAADDGSRHLAGRLEDVDLVIDDLEILERDGKAIPMAEIIGRLRRAHSGGGWSRHG